MSQPPTDDDILDVDAEVMPQQSVSPPLTTRQIRDLLSLMCMTIGLVGLAVVAFTVNPNLGAAVVSVEVLAVGIALGMER